VAVVMLRRTLRLTRLPYSGPAVRALGLVWLVGIFVAVLWDYLFVRVTDLVATLTGP
jgi:hypothetical protein